MKRYVPERGDIAWIDFGHSAGHEQAERRPALILSPQKYNRASGLALACPISRRAKGYPFEVKLPPALQTEGVVLSDHLRSIDWLRREAEFKERAGADVLDEVLARVAALLGP